MPGIGISEVLPIQNEEFTIGRGQTNTIFIADSKVSRRHATIRITVKGWQIEDQSTNGTFINGHKLEKGEQAILRSGDEIEIAGVVTWQFECEEGELASALGDLAPAHEKPSPSELPAIQIFPHPPYWGDTPPGLQRRSLKLLHHLPEIYRSEEQQNLNGHQDGEANGTGPSFLSRFLAICESIHLPIEWTVSNFDLFLAINTAPHEFLVWLAGWYGITFNPSWTDEQRRTLLKDAYLLFARRGAAWSLRRVLEIYTGLAEKDILITDDDDDLAPYTFRVDFLQSPESADKDSVHAIIQAYKPAHTICLCPWFDE